MSKIYLNPKQFADLKALLLGGCDCEFDPYDDSDEESWHYKRLCRCGHVWYSVHCAHDDYQNPCPECGRRNQTVEVGCIRSR